MILGLLYGENWPHSMVSNEPERNVQQNKRSELCKWRHGERYLLTDLNRQIALVDRSWSQQCKQIFYEINFSLFAILLAVKLNRELQQQKLVNDCDLLDFWLMNLFIKHLVDLQDLLRFCCWLLPSWLRLGCPSLVLKMFACSPWIDDECLDISPWNLWSPCIRCRVLNWDTCWRVFGKRRLKKHLILVFHIQFLMIHRRSSSFLVLKIQKIVIWFRTNFFAITLLFTRIYNSAQLFFDLFVIFKNFYQKVFRIFLVNISLDYNFCFLKKAFRCAADRVEWRLFGTCAVGNALTFYLCLKKIWNWATLEWKFRIFRPKSAIFVVEWNKINGWVLRCWRSKFHSWCWNLKSFKI